MGIKAEVFCYVKHMQSCRTLPDKQIIRYTTDNTVPSEPGAHRGNRAR